ncbi:hypothetical protein TeGR_g8202 [Tetraparma gracilis]|uniref:Tetratricopeptide repeat protein n=1 Tax=Tetraparma gracilis TaxID=2962635 RepID=A0ABQ6MLL4_9STRA|nr:hypothetical protein TeGR_g8202 [Tetraparma gracilis]
MGPAVRVLPEKCFTGTGITHLRGIERVREIGALCFAGCRHLETLEGLGPAVRVLPRSCFARTGVTNLRGMQHVRVLEQDCFRDCKELASAEGLSLDREFEIARPLPRLGHAFAGCTKLLPLSLAAPDASPAAVLEYLRMKVRPPSRYAFLACVAYARREQDAGRGSCLDPLLGNIAGRLPDDIIREFVLPFLLGTLETEAGALVLRKMGESHFAAGEYDDAVDYYRQSLDVSQRRALKLASNAELAQAELRHGDAVKQRKLGRFEEAVGNFEAAIEMKRAGNAEQWSIRTSISLLAATHKDMGNAEEAAELRALAKSMPFA